MRVRRRLLSALLFALIILSIAGCGGKKAEEPSPTQEEDEIGEAPFKVALLLPGPITDMGWNASAYEGLMAARDELGVEVAYTENVSPSDAGEFYRGYAERGFGIVIGHGFQFGDGAKLVAKEFPETAFVVTSSNIHEAPNLASVNINDIEAGFILGSIAGLMTKSNKVGYIGGMEIPSIIDAGEGFRGGAKHTNPNIEVSVVYTGSFDDLAKAKESAFSMIEGGVDIMMSNANQAALGSIEACKERSIMAIGYPSDQHDLAPGTVLVSGIKSVPSMFTYVIDLAMQKELEPRFYRLGLKEKALYLSPWYEFEDKVPNEVKEKVKAIIDEIVTGTLELKGLGSE